MAERQLAVYRLDAGDERLYRGRTRIHVTRNRSSSCTCSFRTPTAC